MMKALTRIQGIKLVDYDKKERKLTITGDVDYVTLGACVRKIAHAGLLSVGPASEILAKQHDKPSYKSGKEDKPGYGADRRRIDSATGAGKNMSSSTLARPCRIFSLAEMKSATNNFHDELVNGKGAFGTVYNGQISSEEAGHVVAIKRWDSSSYQGEDEFKAEIDTLCKCRHYQAEIDTLCKCRHYHLVSLIGYSDEKGEKILVFEYMPNGSLHHHLHEAYTPLSLVTRLKIAIGDARGLDYIHTDVSTQYGVIHRDVKSSTILLDENWEAVISDLGFSIICPTKQWNSYVEDIVRGTPGYLDPEYYSTNNLTYKSDVYSFGVVLFELLSGRHVLGKHYWEDYSGLKNWVRQCIEEGKLDQMVDPSFMGTISTECLSGFTQIADRCVREVSKERPTMSELVASLQALLELQEESIYLTEGEESA